MADDYYSGRAAEFASIVDWAKRSIDFTPGVGVLHSMRENGYDPLTEVWGVSAEFFQDTGKHTCVHVVKALYYLCESPPRMTPIYWLAHERAGNPHVYSHDADADLDEDSEDEQTE